MPPAPKPQPGSRTEAFRFAYATGSRPLDGFTIKRGIGVGGFGEVYYAVSDAGKEVALKRIQRHLDVELRGVRQCLNLKHHHLLSLFDIRYDERGEAWVIMEYMLGESLKDVIERAPAGLPTAEVQRWFVSVASGVEYLHDHGIVHRDLKPGNIFDDQGVVKLGDYGLSKFISCSRRSGQTESVGTFHYMAPEIGRGSYGKEIDIYALGIILYELLTGRVPFDGESSHEIIMKHLTADPDLSAVPLEYREPIRRALAKDPERRYRSVGEMLTALRWGGTGFETPRVAPGGVGAAGPTGGVGTSRDPVVLGDEPPDIVFGPVHEVVEAQVVASSGATGPRGNSPSFSATWDREPIAASARDSLKRLAAWWQSWPLALPVKIAILVGIAWVALVNSHWLIPLLVTAAVAYGVYFAVWLLVAASGGTSLGPAAHQAQVEAAMAHAAAVQAAQTRTANKKKSKIKQVDQLRPLLGERRGAERYGDLLGSYLFSFLASAVLSVIALLVGGRQLDSSVETWATYAWVVLASTGLAWMVLTLGKVWETRAGDTSHRRFVMLIAGLGLGVAGFGLNVFLGQPLQGNVTKVVDPAMWRLYSAGTPLLSAWLVHCGALCVGLRWWRQADPLRTTRLSLWSVAVVGIAGALLQVFVPLYEPWMMLTGIVAAISIQLAAPWVSPEQRTQMRDRLASA